MPFYDALVVGGGMIGSAALRHLTLTKPHLRLGAVAPSEPQDWAHHEGVFSSHYDEGRITRMLDPDDVWSRLAEESIGRYGSIEDFSGVSFFNESGFVAVGRDEEGSWLRQVKDSSERRNVSRKILSGEEARSRFYPIHFPDEATVLYQKERAGHISPRKFVRASLKASEKRGADLIDEDAEAVSASASWDEEAGKGWENPSVDGEGVGASESDGRLWDVLLKNGTVVRARRVLVSTGAFTNPRLLNGLRGGSLDV
uniref:FAD dependent oxidoreductase domain-containing protein n=1 Tax=Chromera velia CCMP2878 TaxID=1169474 RepID=A0A0G4HJR9_9ALVE|eukprot:Cvel_7116.t1-p1 / transcript=Cvel_7116.t1 / gene=Cvel_7116 / organism=Chromera_velia_CCMP2878 / gene_product=Monomeric sarcosine oxidase, putative / transcript_product=Monomeric sarcosine oxidase, putative / location=Cvel_scaffold365:194-1331(-) / protein_length=255 / sequence_SO=supercontig / SO=protein_coding / is_pseudo=false